LVPQERHEQHVFVGTLVPMERTHAALSFVPLNA
jgi:hypothetical protein